MASRDMTNPLPRYYLYDVAAHYSFSCEATCEAVSTGPVSVLRAAAMAYSNFHHAQWLNLIVAIIEASGVAVESISIGACHGRFA